MTRTQFLLLKLSEECVEVAQRAAKQMQFGRNEIQKDQFLTNSERLAGELADLAAIINLLEKEKELVWIGPAEWNKRMDEKYKKVEKYLIYSQSLGMVESAWPDLT